MTISANVRNELFELGAAEQARLIRIRPTDAKAGTTVYSSRQSQPLRMWTQEEHEKFLEAMEKYPSGPWKNIAAFIGTKTTRQTMTHAQKYRQKIGRWRRGLRHKGRRGAPATAPNQPSEDDGGNQKADDHETNSHQGEAAANDELFRLAEVASSSVRPNKEGEGLEPAQEDKFTATTSRELNTRDNGVKLTSLRQTTGMETSQHFLHDDARKNSMLMMMTAPMDPNYQLPPLQYGAPMASMAMPAPEPNDTRSVASNSSDDVAIPPLRSKINPNVLEHQYSTV